VNLVVGGGAAAGAAAHTTPLKERGRVYTPPQKSPTRRASQKERLFEVGVDRRVNPA
jgi:hypothetical protein